MHKEHYGSQIPNLPDHDEGMSDKEVWESIIKNKIHPCIECINREDTKTCGWRFRNIYNSPSRIYYGVCPDCWRYIWTDSAEGREILKTRKELRCN